MTAEDFKRKLTAILSADVVGYSRLMGEDEDSTVQTLTAYRELMSGLIGRYRGRVVDSPGDNLLAEFGSVMDAVRCAVEIQEELRIRNAELPESRKMQFRIGINLGDVIEEGDRIYGDGINVAARVEGLAEGGGICISGTVYDSIRNKLSWSYDFLGEHNVKNIKEPVRIYRIRMEPEAVTAIVKEKEARLTTWQRAALAIVVIFILAAVAIWYFSVRQVPVVVDVEEAPVVADVEEALKTIAVLPFDDLSPEKDQEHFVLGLSEEILNSLCQIPNLGVAGKTSSFSFKGSKKTIREIASVLGVENILEGSVRKAGNALRITAQLVRAADGLHLWSKTYDKELKDIFDVQEDIATSVADELKVTLGISKPLKQLGSTDNLEAYELYLTVKGLDYTMPSDYRIRQLELLDEAIALDPEFALAWAYKGIVHIMSLLIASSDISSLELDPGLNAALKAIELEPRLGKGYFSLGFVYNRWGKLIEAGAAYRKGMELATESRDYWRYGVTAHYTTVGYIRKCYELLEEARSNDPLDLAIRGYYIYFLALVSDIQKAEEENKRCKAILGDEFTYGDYFISRVRLESNDVLSINEIPKDWESDRILAIARKNIESPENGLAELRRLYSSDDNPYFLDLQHIASLAAYFGDPEFALDVIERAYKTALNYWTPIFHDVRQLPRFKEFVREIGLVDYWKEFGWPDLCHPVGDDDFECD